MGGETDSTADKYTVRLKSMDTVGIYIKLGSIVRLITELHHNNYYGYH